ncbi:MAG: DUF2852 domain-containing protein [Candidatus Competibacter sp.]|jgi:hypothetical protein
MILAAKPHSFDKAAGIGLIVLGFMLWWPLGLAILAYLFWSGKMRCWQSDDPDHSQRHVFWAFMQNKGHGCCGRRRSASSGNTAFDEYRDATLRRLEEDQREFVEFLDRLRRARDRAEFDQFMAEQDRRRANPEQPAAN